MKKLFLILYALLCNSHSIYTMEQQPSRVRSLQNMCLTCIGNNPEQIDLLSNLPNLPADLASNAILNTQLHYLAEHKDEFTALIRENQLDHVILSSVAYALCCYKKRADKGVKDFLTDIHNITTTLTNGTINPAVLPEFINAQKIVIPTMAPTSKQEPFQKKLNVFNQLATQIYNNQVVGNIDANQELLKTLTINAQECIEELNNINTYNATICPHTTFSDIAQHHLLSPELAGMLYADFINAPIPDNFDQLFNHYFSANILQNDNERLIYTLLSQTPLTPAMQISTQPFPVQDFEQQLPATLNKTEDSSLIEVTCNANKKYKSFIHAGFLSQLGCNTIFTTYINPTCNLLLIHYKINGIAGSSFFGLINTKNLISLCIPCASENEVTKIGLSADCSQLGYMKTNGTVVSYILPTELTTLAPLFKQRAFITYSNAQIVAMTQETMSLDRNNIGLRIKGISKLSLNKMQKLVNFIQTNKHLVSDSLYVMVYKNLITQLQEIIDLYTAAQYIANVLHVDMATLGDKLVSGEITPQQTGAILATRPK